jgi:glycosyltransferase involved in cell wall biosynthesis
MGGFNYLVNLLRILGERTPDRIAPVLFVGTDLPNDLLGPLTQLPHVTMVRHRDFNEANKARRLASSLLNGRDDVALKHFTKSGIQVAFEPAQFHGWRFPLPTIAWTPDFQHRELAHLFETSAFWRRELGFRAQVMSKRQIMVSSEDARRACESFYPGSRGYTHVVRFAVQTRPIDDQFARAIAERYGLPSKFFYLPNQFWRHKNHECVIRALRILKDRGESVVIAATGKQDSRVDPKLFPRLMGMVGKWHLKSEFRPLGLIPLQHVFALMQASVALINPSLFEGWSTTVEEAKAIGVPMLLSSIEVHKEQAGKLAVYFDPHSPEDLATALRDFKPLNEQERRNAHHQAVADTEQRVQQFADEFCTVVERASRQWRMRRGSSQWQRLG